MRAFLKERQAAMRARHVSDRVVATLPLPGHPVHIRPRIDASKARFRIEQEGGLYVVRDTISGLIVSTCTKEAYAKASAAKLNKLPMRHIQRQRTRTEANLVNKKKSQKENGTRWSKFGMVNADITSPTHKSIRNWGLKIKVRENPS